MTTTARIRIRRDTAAAFTSANPVLALGEIAYETDTKRLKVGNGASVWTALAYAAESPVNLIVQGTGSMTVPSGTTGERPAAPTIGMIRFNSTSSRLEYYSGAAWVMLPNTQPTEYEVEYLVVGGGGSGGSISSLASGGGGGGGYRTNVGGTKLTLTSNSFYTVIIGAGGAGTGEGASGSDSIFSTITSTGGGRGGREPYGAVPSPPYAGGSGGGAGGSQVGSGAPGNTPATTPSQGNAGGSNAAQAPVRFAAGGGGGAGAVGSTGVLGTGAGAGGAGTANSISGSSVTYAGGGGGGYGWYTSVGAPFPGGAGGAGGGGLGAGNGNNAVGGTPNTGGGGGGGCYEDFNGTTIARSNRAGGSGIVIIRYLGAQVATGGAVTSSGGYTIHTFLSSGTFTT